MFVSFQIPDMVSSSFMFMVRGYSKNNKFTATMDSLQSGVSV